jgi:hypothetical protein
MGWILLISLLENMRHGRGRETLKHQYRVYCLGRSAVEGDPSKRAGAHCHTRAWARYRGLMAKYQEGH